MTARRLQRAWDRFLGYLPVVFMGLMALASWWLVRSAPSVPSDVQEPVRGHEPDYFMQGFSVKNFGPEGQLLSEVHGEMGRHYPDTDTLEIDRMRLSARDASGRTTQASADRALSNADGSEVQLFGNAKVVREAAPGAAGRSQPRLAFEGEFLHVWPQLERVRSHQPVTLTRGNDRFTGDSLAYDHIAQVLELQGRVRGQLSPKK
ncbi:MAG: LPS export ABC transporter periplasmic protein LptC [Simplicispira sp.]|jgi:lipopolysaccharide export system protein LptC|nr:LPS export ABC transporter periplasmic protein LptC [Simplicispira sp.]